MRANARPLLSLLALALATIGAFFVPVSAGTTVPGNDYSWPQCPRGVGNGQGHPLPPGSHAFAVVGLTNGTGLHENPCLASQWGYARSHANFVTGYAIVTYPTRTQLSAARAGGHYGRCTTLVCELKNNGWAQGEFTDRSLRKVGARPPMVWIDVETRSQQPWSSTVTRNAVVVRAVIASLQAHGYRVGIYSNHYLWNHIAGFRTSLPEWVPAGSFTAGCRMSFAGGVVYLSQWTRGAYDENGVCRGVPRMTGWLQRAHPSIVVHRDATTGALGARYDGGRQFSLGARSPYAGSVALVPSVAGPVPLFAATGSDGQARLRTLATGWQPTGVSGCAGAPAVATATGQATVTCTTAAGVPVAATVALDAAGAPHAG